MTVNDELVHRFSIDGASTELVGLYNPHELNDKTWVSGASQPLFDDYIASCLRPLHAAISSLWLRGFMAPSFGGHFVDKSWGPANVSSFWTEVLRKVPIGLDVLMVQDGNGVASRLPANSSTRWTSPSEVVPFCHAFACATRANGVELWSDVEIFQNFEHCRGTSCQSSGPAPLTRIIQQMKAEGPIVAHLTAWEWSEYLSPHTRDASNKSRVLYQQYKTWHSSSAKAHVRAKRDDASPEWPKPAAGDGVVGSAGTDLEHIMGGPGPVSNGVSK